MLRHAFGLLSHTASLRQAGLSRDAPTYVQLPSAFAGRAPFAAMRVFVRIAEAGSLSAAGRQLGVSLNSVSRQLIALEEMLGTTLVERTTRHLSLTEAGRLYQERAKEILEEVAEAERGLTAQTGVASGRLCVSAPSLLGRMRLSPILPTFLAEQSQVSIDLMLADRPIRLAEEGIDVALLHDPSEFC
jgi:molybdate transport repressor ModE-like protein